MNKAETWDCALRGAAGSVIDPLTKEEARKKMLLDRFQEEVLYLFRNRISSFVLITFSITASRV